MVAQPHKAFTNFWGALADNGFYARSGDYMDIVDRKLTGIWNVPFINTVLVISKNKVRSNHMYMHQAVF